MKKNNSKRTKRGAASLYVVIFITLLFGIITLSFIRLIISEAVQTTNTDLSQSAYDSALAGIEDAKVALLKYHDCLSRGFVANKDGDECGKTIWNMQQHIDTDSCDPVTATLGRTQEEDGSVIVQETVNSSQAGNAADMVQAYTCVKIDEELEDYRTTLDTNSRLRIIPIRSSYIDELGSIQISWFSSQNKGNLSSFNWYGITRNEASIPPVISVQLLQADPTFKMSELSVSSAVGTDRATAYLVPSQTSDLTDNKMNASVFASTSNKAPNNAYKVRCEDIGSTAEWYCTAEIAVPGPYRNSKKANGVTDRNDGATFVIVTLPYGDPSTDISLQLFKSNGERINFTGVQARVDSTGRANDLYRRVETRVELVDVNYPYPEFTIKMNDGQDNVIRKNFAVTRNCWSANGGSYHECPDNQQL